MLRSLMVAAAISSLTAAGILAANQGQATRSEPLCCVSCEPGCECCLDPVVTCDDCQCGSCACEACLQDSAAESSTCPSGTPAACCAGESEVAEADLSAVMSVAFTCVANDACDVCLDPRCECDACIGDATTR